MLEFSGDTTRVENGVTALGSLQIERHYDQSIAELEVIRCCVTMHDYLLVFPHLWLIAPLVAQPIQLARLATIDSPDFKQSVDQAIHIIAVLVELYPLPCGCPVVKGRQEIRECGKFLIELSILTALDRL